MQRAYNCTKQVRKKADEQNTDFIIFKVIMEIAVCLNIYKYENL